MNFYNLQVLYLEGRYSPRCSIILYTCIGYDNIHLLYCDRQLCVCMDFLQMGIYPITIQSRAIYSSIFMYICRRKVFVFWRRMISIQKILTIQKIHTQQQVGTLGPDHLFAQNQLSPSPTNTMYRLVYPVNEWKYSYTYMYYK